MEINIKKLLEKYKFLKDPREEKQRIAKIISEEIKEEIDYNSISISNGILRISSNPYTKSEILLRKEKILNRLKDEDLKIFEIN